MCDEYNAVYIADSVQCGYGRTGKFFSHDFAGVNADIYTMAKGMGNGFPVGRDFHCATYQAKTFYAGHYIRWQSSGLCCSTCCTGIIEEEKLMGNAVMVGKYLIDELENIPELKM